MNKSEIEKAVAHLTTCEPPNRGVAYKLIEEVIPNIDAQGFNQVCDAYREASGITIPQSAAGKQRQARKDVIAWAHNATTADVRENIEKMGAKPNDKFWENWKLFKAGAYQSGETENQLTIDDFKDHFDAGQAAVPDEKKVAEGLSKLVEAKGKIKTRGEAFNLITNNGEIKLPANVYSEVVKQFEEQSGKTLKSSKASEEKRELYKEIHNWNTADVTNHLNSLMGGEVDPKFWAAFELRKLGKWNNKINSNLFSQVLENQPSRQAEQKAEQQPETAAA